MSTTNQTGHGTTPAVPSNGFIAFVKEECPTCKKVAPVLHVIAQKSEIIVASQDDPSFPAGFSAIYDDEELALTFRYKVETVPTVIKLEDGKETGRAIGWNTNEWRDLTGIPDLGAGLPANVPGCGSRSVEPGVEDLLQVAYDPPYFGTPEIVISRWSDEHEIMYERGWTDGLPVIPPTRERVLRMLAGTARDPSEVLGDIPPNLVPLTVELAAVSAVMAGCKPEYMPVLLTAVEAALEPLFTLHGLTCTTCFSSPIIIVNGPIAKQIGMNSGMNVLGQGNRANATIGRALNLIVRNVGGGLPGVMDRSTLGAPSKYTLCFAEREDDETWQPLSVARGFESGANVVTLFQGEGILGCTDQRSRTADQMAKSYAMSLAAVGHPKLAQWCNAILVMSPEHHTIFRNEGWDRTRITDAILKELRRPADDLLNGVQGVGEGLTENWRGKMVDKFPEGGFEIVRAGGDAGLYSAILVGWTGGRFVDESRTVSKEIIR